MKMNKGRPELAQIFDKSAIVPVISIGTVDRAVTFISIGNES